MRDPDHYVPYPGAVRTAADFKVGDTAIVTADQGIRIGEVTKVARTRVTVRHPRNKQGAMVERPYGMDVIVIGQARGPLQGWVLVFATGHTGGWPGDTYHLPVITEPKAPYRDEPR